MTVASPTFLGRSDTFFGVCEAIGQDTAINANLLRIALGVGVLFAPVMVIAVYGLLAVAVIASRVIFPVPAAVVAAPVVVSNDFDAEPMKLVA
jgi:phage shock protein C